MLYVVEPGFLTTVQDAGRWGWARYGVPPSGPMDRAAHKAANTLVGNAPDAAALEITLLGPHLVANRDCLIAVCGADFDVQVGPLPVPTWHAVYVRSGYHIIVGHPRSGARAILAITGGIYIPPFLGSRATYLMGGFGGFQGRALQTGDQLPLGPTSLTHPAMRAGTAWPIVQRPSYTRTPILRVVMGPQDDYFGADTLATFLASAYTISESSDRMGMRLQGPHLVHQKGSGIISDGIVTGSIQIPPDGLPIVMMVDHQTTGGYPKIATVIQADIPILAQCVPGDTIRFEAISLAMAHQTLICSP
jgi:antagonist of KipI